MLQGGLLRLSHWDSPGRVIAGIPWPLANQSLNLLLARSQKPKHASHTRAFDLGWLVVANGA